MLKVPMESTDFFLMEAKRRNSNKKKKMLVKRLRRVRLGAHRRVLASSFSSSTIPESYCAVEELIVIEREPELKPWENAKDVKAFRSGDSDTVVIGSIWHQRGVRLHAIKLDDSCVDRV